MRNSIIGLFNKPGLDKNRISSYIRITTRFVETTVLVEYSGLTVSFY